MSPIWEIWIIKGTKIYLTTSMCVYLCCIAVHFLTTYISVCMCQSYIISSHMEKSYISVINFYETLQN